MTKRKNGSGSSNRVWRPVEGERKDMIDRWVAEAVREASLAIMASERIEKPKTKVIRTNLKQRHLPPPPPRRLPIQPNRCSAITKLATLTKTEGDVAEISGPFKKPQNKLKRPPSIKSQGDAADMNITGTITKPLKPQEVASSKVDGDFTMPLLSTQPRRFRSMRNTTTQTLKKLEEVSFMKEEEFREITVCDTSNVSSITSSGHSTHSCDIVGNTIHYRRYRMLRSTKTSSEDIPGDKCDGKKTNKYPPTWIEHITATKRMLRAQKQPSSSVVTSSTAATGLTSSPSWCQIDDAIESPSWCQIDDEINETVVLG